jgi:hypothetical protein
MSCTKGLRSARLYRFEFSRRSSRFLGCIKACGLVHSFSSVNLTVHASSHEADFSCFPIGSRSSIIRTRQHLTPYRGRPTLE